MPKRLKTLKKQSKYSRLTSVIAQGMVFINGIVITITAFFGFSYFISTMSDDGYRRISQDAGRVLIEGIYNIENPVRLVSSVIYLSESKNKDSLVEQIKHSIPNMSRFDQMIWLYELYPGNWQYKVIFESQKKGGAIYNLKLNKEMIARLVRDNVFKTEDLHLILNFDGMDYLEEQKNPQIMARPFALTKAIDAGDLSKGIIIGVSRASLIFGQESVFGNDVVSRMSVRDVKTGHRIYHMNMGTDDVISQWNSQQQDYGFVVGDSEWQVVLEFMKDKHVTMLEKVPYVILVFGFILTVVGTLFVRNNYKQSRAMTAMNKMLERKNYELQSEVTERERLNTALVIAEKNNRAIIDSVSDIIFETDVNGNLLFLSASWQKVSGFEVDRSMGGNLFSMIYPADQDKQKLDFEQMVKGNKEAYRSFTRLRIADGTFRAVELAMSMIRQDEDRKTRVVGTITDVEERRRAERALAEAEKKYRTIVENAAGGLYQLTPEGIYLSANPAMARVLGYDSPEDMLRLIKNANGVVYKNVTERQKFMNTLIVQKQIFGYETEVLKKDGQTIWVRENIRTVNDDQNHVLYFEGSMEDITERKKADIALMEAKIQSDMTNRAKTEFIANMSHELRTPLNAIIGFSDIMKNEIMGPLGQEIYKEYIDDINKSGQGLLKIINEILEISKIDSGNRELNESEFWFEGVVNACIDLYGTRAREKNITIVNEVTSPPLLVGEELAIKQVIGNIYSNAIKYTTNGGRITLYSSYDTEGVFRFSITDTGVGMNEKEIEKALSPFGQIDNALDRSGTGTGLGLSLAQAMMHIHDGDIEILSEKSIGTTVTLVFPSKRVVNQGQGASDKVST